MDGRFQNHDFSWPTQSHKTVRTAKIPQSAAEWELHRSVITELYFTQDLKLKTVRSIMEDKYHFKASKRMYMTRLRAWDLYKNYKAEQKEELAIKIARAVVDRRPLTDMTIGNRPVKLQRVLRHVKATFRAREARKRHKGQNQVLDDNDKIQHIHECDPRMLLQSSSVDSLTLQLTPSSCLTPTSRSSSIDFTGLDQLNMGSISPQSPLPFPRTTVNLELILMQCDVMFKLRPGLFILGKVDPMLTFWSNIRNAVYFLKAQSQHLAWPLLQHAYNIVTENIASVDFSFLRELFATLSPVNTKLHPEVRVQLLRYLAQLVEHSPYLGKGHPLSIICQQLGLDNGTREVSQRCLTRMMDLYPDAISDASGEKLKIQFGLASLLRRDEALESAEYLSRKLIRESEEWFGLYAEQTCDAMMELVCVYTDMQQYARAIEICSDVLRRQRSRLGHLYPNSRASYAMENMAELYEYSEDPDNCIHWLREALVSAWNLRGGTASTMHVRNKLEKMLVATGNSEEASTLAFAYPQTVVEIV